MYNFPIFTLLQRPCESKRLAEALPLGRQRGQGQEATEAANYNIILYALI